MSAGNFLCLRPFFLRTWFVTVALCCAVSSALAAATPAATATTLVITSGGKAITQVVAGQTVTFTATVLAGANHVTAGTVNFCDAAAAACTDIHLLGSAALGSSGTAQLTVIPLPGTHSYKAAFHGTTTDTASSSSDASLAVISATTTAITQSGSAGSYTLKATVTGKGNTTGPTGKISFLDTSNQNAVLGTAELGTATDALAWSTPQSATTAAEPQSIVVADFNGDGIPDIALGTNGTAGSNDIGSVNLLPGNGDGTFQAAKAFTGLVGNQLIAAAPFVTGGPEDILAVNNSTSTTNNALLFLGDGKGGLTGGTPFSLGIDTVTAILTGDFNGDGNEDFVVGGLAFGVPAFNMFLGKGDGTFNTGTLNATSKVPITALGAGDFTGQGSLDLAVAHSDGTVDIFLQDGAGDFFPNAGTQAGSSPTAIAVGDFNGDGKTDLAITNSAADSVSILLGKGDGTFTAAASPVTGSVPKAIAVGDFNGDGVADLAVANSGADTVTVLLGKGDGTFTVEPTLDTGNTPVALAVGAFDGSDTSDIAVANEDPTSNAIDGTATILLAQLTQTATATATGIAPAGGGVHLADASYPGDENYAASVSATTSLTGTGGTFTVSVAPTSLAFSGQVGGTSAAQTVKLSNTGASAVSISSVTATANFAVSSACGSSLAVGANCLISVTFIPTAAGNITGTLKITDNATGSPQSVALSGTATTPAPTVTVTPASLTFTTQPVGAASAAQTVTLTNTGQIAVGVTSIAASGDFAQTNTCGTSVAVAANCTISVTFTPTTSGSRTGTLTITDNATGSPQSVALAGDGSSVSLAASSQTLTLGASGGSTTDAVQISSAQGFSGTVNLTCAVMYQGTGVATNPPTCSLSPASGQVTSSTPLSSTLTVSTGTGAQPQVAMRSVHSVNQPSSGWQRTGAVFAALVFVGFFPRRRWKNLQLALLLVLGLGMAWSATGCGGSSTKTTKGTTAGSYQVSVTATSATVTATTTIALTVQ
jgi:hypothetical protein